MAHTTFPSNIPKPENDGACDHLTGRSFPSLALPSTSGSSSDISQLPGLTVLFCYPRTAAPDETVPDEWNQIPGARGCTPQACSFRDASAAFAAHGVHRILGASTQSTSYQRELQERTRLPYELLSDEKLELVKALELPTMEWEGQVLMKRLSMVVDNGAIVKVFYPVFPPDESASEVLRWLETEYWGRRN